MSRIFSGEGWSGSVLPARGGHLILSEDILGWVASCPLPIQRLFQYRRRQSLYRNVPSASKYNLSGVGDERFERSQDTQITLMGPEDDINVDEDRVSYTL